MTSINAQSLSFPEFTPEVFARFRALLQEQCGMYFDENKMSVVRNMLYERMSALNLLDYTAYYKLLNEAPQPNPGPDDPRQPPTGHRMLSREMRRLVEGLAVNETSFFRNREHYRAISEEVLPYIFRQHKMDRHVRIWSAGCSTGQEPYSLAIAALEALASIGEYKDKWRIEIVATDISEKVLRVAHAGRYRTESMRGLSPAHLDHYFRPLSAASVATAPLDPSAIYQPGSIIGEHRPRMAYEVSPQIRELVKFYFFNLVNPLYPIDKFYNFDLVLCENVTIYFPAEVTRRVIHNIYETMVQGAYLFIGYSETLWQVSDRFKLINTHDTFYYQKPVTGEDLQRSYIRRKPSTDPLAAEPTTQPSRRTTDPLISRMPPPVTQPPVSPERNRITNPLFKAVEPDKTQPPRLPKQNPTWFPSTPSSVTPIKAKASSSWTDLLAEGKQRMADHDFDRAEAVLEAALKLAPNEVDVLCATAEIKLKLGDYRTATRLCQKAVNLNNLSEAAHLMLAMIYHKEGHIKEAIQEYQHTIYINLDAVIAYMRLADIYRDTGHQANALREYTRAYAVLKKKNPDEMIEDLSVSLLMQACEQNITRLSPRHR